MPKSTIIGKITIMQKSIYYILIAIFSISLFSWAIFDQKLTARDIKNPTGEYTVPHNARGGIVYVTKEENIIFLCGLALMGTSIVTVIVVALLQANNRYKK